MVLIRPNMAEVLIKPEAIPIIKRPKASHIAVGAIAERVKPTITNSKPIFRVHKNPKLLLIRPKNNKVAKQPNI